MAWNDLSMAEKAQVMKLAVEGGVYDLDAIREGYNEFAKGGHIYDGESENTQQMTVQRTPHVDLAISNPWLYNKLHPSEKKEESYEPATFAGRVAQVAGAGELGQKYADYSSSVIQQVPGIGLVPSALDLGYDINRMYHNPSITTAKDVALDAASLLPALRKTFKGWWMKGNSGSFITETGQVINNPRVASSLEVMLQPYRTAVNTGIYAGRAADFLDDSKAYLKDMYNDSPIGKHFPIKALGGPIVEDAMNEYKHGGNIHIKPSHRGRLTELKARTGKSEAELYNDGNPAHKKMVVFARNSRKWKHAYGGELGNYYDGWGDAWNFLKSGVQKARQKVKDWGLDKSPAQHLKEVLTPTADKKYRQNLYNIIDPTSDIPSGVDIAKYGIIALAAKYGGDYPYQRTKVDSVADAAWAKRLGLDYNQSALIDNGDGTVRLPSEIEAEIPTDTTALKQRIANNEKRLKQLHGGERRLTGAAIDFDKEALEALRKTYSTGEPVMLDEHSHVSRNWQGLTPESAITTPLNTLHRYTVRYDKDNNRMKYWDWYDFNGFEDFVPGSPYKIQGFIDLNKKK